MFGKNSVGRKKVLRGRKCWEEESVEGIKYWEDVHSDVNTVINMLNFSSLYYFFSYIIL